MLRKLLNLLSDVAVYGVSGLLDKLVGFLLLPLYTKYLEPADYFILAMLLLVASVFVPLANLGMSNAIFRRFNFEKGKQQRGQVLSTALASATVSALLLLAVGWLCASLIARVTIGEETEVELVRLTLLSAFAVTIGNVPLAVLRAERRVKTTAAINLSRLLLSASATIWFVVAEEMGVRGVVLGSLVADVTMMIAQVAITSRSFRFAASLQTWRNMAAYGLPFVPHHLQALAMVMLGQYVVGHELGETEGGLYGIALRFALPVTFVVNSVQSAWGAFKFQIHAEDDRPTDFFASAVTYYVAMLMYLWVGVSLWGPEMVWLLTEVHYYPAAWLVPLAGLIPIAQGLYFMMGTGIELSDSTRAYPLVSFTGLVVVSICVLTLVSVLGAVGAAIGTTAAWLAMAVVVYYLSQRRIAISYDWGIVFALIALAIVAEGAAYVTLQLPAVPRISLALAISGLFPLAEFAILLRSNAERERMRLLWSKVTRLRQRRRSALAASVSEVVASESTR